MAPKQPIPRQEDRSDDIVGGQWGGDGPRPSGHRRSVTQLLRNRSMPLVLAGLGAVAGLASLTQTWVVVHLSPFSPGGDTFQETVVGTDRLGLLYLVGILGMAVTVALALYGTGATRSNARVAGLALAAALLAVLVAGMTTIGDQGTGSDTKYGRGMVAALLTCALLGAAVLLAPAGGRSEPGAGAATPEDGAATPEDDAAAPAEGAATPARRTRAPRRAAADDLPPPADLTVRPTAPFIHPD